ncbi:lipopolysaccharide biosynthesis protein [Clostridium sp. 'White wine YQ']|uniref:lipopolysaccharide biosynthesis protein n=1 Tax=Clostridium sp. 'White wine YQ' TaxID=3027474 RepID=UPI0023663B68|nr:oligosaccharide flippase family protein [Clostridium sp. 'White wine YQ']MDD7792756.1 oligosaccharide flippase family protein [Clostridium sp. 'White wine YQ']
MKKLNLKEIKNKILHNRILNNLIIMLTGDTLVSLIGIVNLSLALWTVGLEGNGIIVMIQTYCVMFSDIFNFQSFNALIKFLPIYIQENDSVKCKKVIKQALTLDISTAIIATLVGYACIYPISKIMGWDSTVILYLNIYMVTVIFNINGTSVGILRIFNKFNLTTYTAIITALFKLFFYFVGFFLKFNFIYFLMVEITLEIIRNILQLIFAYRVLKEQQLNDFYKYNFKFEKEFLVFSFYSNIVSTLDIPVKYLTTFVINKYLGFNEISIYKIFQKIGTIIEKVGVPLSQIVYPEMSKMIAKREYENAFKLNRKLMKLLLLGGIVVLAATGLTYKLWLRLFISDYNLYINQLIAYLLVIVIAYSAIGIHSIFMALGYIKYNLPILLFVNSTYLILLFFGVKNYELIGVIFSLLLQTVMVISIKIIILKRNDYSIFEFKKLSMSKKE